MTGVTTKKKDAFSLVGIGVAACVACCAVPVLAFLGGLSTAGAVSTVFIGIVGLAVASLAGAAYLLLRHRRSQTSCSPELPRPVPVSSPTRRT
jgi:hypothetical protein